MNLYRIFIAAVFLAAVPCMAVVSFSKQVVKVGETIEVTATPPEGFEFDKRKSPNPLISGPVSVTFDPGSRLKCTLTATGPSTNVNDVSVTYYWVRGTGSSEENTKSSNEATVVYVKLEPVANGDEGEDPIISPVICMNAQDKYKKATWEVTVLPKDSTATLFARTSIVQFDNGTSILEHIKSGNYVVTGTKTGVYELHLQHDLLLACSSDSVGGVFKFVYEVRQDWQSYKNKKVAYLRRKSKKGQISCKANHGLSPKKMDSRKTSNVGIRTGRITVEPRFQYPLKLKAIMGFQAYQQGYLYCTGMRIYVPYIGLITNGTELVWDSSVDIKDNKAIMEHDNDRQSAKAPTAWVIPVDIASLNRPYEFNHEGEVVLNSEIITQAKVSLSGGGWGENEGKGMFARTSQSGGVALPTAKFAHITSIAHPSFTQFQITE